MSTIQELKDELEILMALPDSQAKQLRTLALIGKILVHMEALERLYFRQDMKVTAIENKLDEGGKVEVNVRYR
jgi:hypothetical protein